jgi:hypothetical protein
MSSKHKLHTVTAARNTIATSMLAFITGLTGYATDHAIYRTSHPTRYWLSRTVHSTQKYTLLRLGYASPIGIHENLPAAIPFMLRGHEAFQYLQYTDTHANPDHDLSNCVLSTIILYGGHGRLKRNVHPGSGSTR